MLIQMLLWMILLGLAIFLLGRVFQGKEQQRRQSAEQVRTASSSEQMASSEKGNVYEHPVEPEEVHYSEEANLRFLEEAKALFVQLQEAWNEEQLDVLQQHTSPGLFARPPRESSPSVHIVVLDAELIKREQAPRQSFAQVRFYGQWRYGEQAAEAFEQLWFFEKENGEQAEWILNKVTSA